MTEDSIVRLLLAILLSGSLIALLIYFLRRNGTQSSVLQTLLQVGQQQQNHLSGLSEKLSHLEPMNQAIHNARIELRTLGERVAQLERNQSDLDHGLGILASGSDRSLAELKTLTKGLNQTALSIRDELNKAQNDLSELQAGSKARQDMEAKITDSISRLETIIAGTHSKGTAGENILDAVFAKLPPEWQVRNFKVKGKSVEFGLKLPNSLILPIDSKWTATSLVEQFVSEESTDKQQKIKKNIEWAVLNKAREVQKYIDPGITVSFGVAVVPDAIYDLSGSIQAEVFQLNVVLVSYSLFVPYLLLVFQTILKNNQSVDLEKLGAYVRAAQQSIQILQEELDGRLSRALSMMTNSRDDMRNHLSKMNSQISGVMVESGTAKLKKADKEQSEENGE
ncbi:DNA recombination protein RmuC [candidate division KSB1 bacterium]|nr:DNA recombination protein RmuC [candidate division KSB1 bacterium]